jgi:hypothetical protein
MLLLFRSAPVVVEAPPIRANLARRWLRHKIPPYDYGLDRRG